MKTLISTNKIFRLNLSKEDADYIDEIRNSKVNAHTVVFYDKTDSGEEGLKLMEKILSAARLEPNLYVLVDVSVNSSIRLRNLRSVFSELIYIISFDQIPASLGLNISLGKYQVQEIGPLRILASDSLSKLQSTESLKRELWNSLKSMYSL